MKLEIPRQIFEKYSNIVFHGHSFSRRQVVPRGKRKEIHDEANSR